MIISSLVISLTLALDSLLAASNVANTSNVGIMVYDLNTDSCLYEKNARHTMRPASTQKLITGITALENLGDYYQYTTSVSYTGSIDTAYVFCPDDSTRQLRRGSLQGNLYIIGVMDPKLNTDDLDILADELYKMGIDTITGNVCGDASFMNDNKYGNGWCWDDDNPELCSLLFGRKEALLPNFAKALRRAGIVILGDVVVRSCPSSASPLISCTHSLPEILERMMKDSNNTYAETMLYHLGAIQGKPATAKKGFALEEELLKKIYAESPTQLTHGKTSVPSHRFADGSGLSLYNYLSPEIEVAFLRYAYTQKNIYPHLREALPIAGVDGTLEKRMKNTGAENNVRAKTGTLTGVISLAGYCFTKDYHNIAFSIICNGCLSANNARALQDKICTILCNYQCTQSIPIIQNIPIE